MKMGRREGWVELVEERGKRALTNDHAGHFVEFFGRCPDSGEAEVD